MGIRRSAARSSFVTIVACAAVAASVTSGCHSGASAKDDGGTAAGLADGSTAGLADGSAGSSGSSDTGAAGTGGGTAGTGGDGLVGPPRPLPTIVDLQPLDLSTGRDGTIRVLAWNSGSPLGADLMAALASSFAVRTWPELASVPLEASTTDAQSTQFAQIVLTPRARLEDRWYELVAKLPDGVTWPVGGTSGLLTLDDGARAARFRVGSLPLVVGVAVYAKTADALTVYVALSEVFPAASLPVPTISYVGGDPSSCVFERPADSSKLPTLRFTCPSDLDLTRSIQLALEPMAGAVPEPALEGGEAATFTIAPADWATLSDGSRFWKRRYP